MPDNPEDLERYPRRVPSSSDRRVFIALALIAGVWCGVFLLWLFFGGPFGPDN